GLPVEQRDLAAATGLASRFALVLGSLVVAFIFSFGRLFVLGRLSRLLVSGLGGLIGVIRRWRVRGAGSGIVVIVIVIATGGEQAGDDRRAQAEREPALEHGAAVHHPAPHLSPELIDL